MSPRPSGVCPRPLLAFGTFRLDPDSGQLFDAAGRVVALQPQPARLLTLLVSRPGERIGRDEIRDFLWGESAVDVEAGVSYAVRRIRKALGDSAEHPRYLETLPRRGYRFIADVRDVSAESESAEVGSRSRSGPRQRSLRNASLVAAVLLGATMGLVRSLPTDLSKSGDLASTEQIHGAAAPARALARDALLRGEYLLQQTDPGSRERASLLFRRALAADPSFAPAYLALAKARRDTYPSEDRRELLLRASRLDPDLPGVASGFGWLALLEERDPARALKLFREDLERAPDLTDALHGTALAAAAAGRWGLALEALQQALESAPAQTALQGDAAQILFWAGRTERAMEQADRALELVPDAVGIRWMTLTQQAAIGDWSRAAEQATSLLPEDRRLRLLQEIGNDAPRQLVERFLAGMEEYHRAEISQPLPAWNLAEIALALGLHQPALEQLARAAEESWPELVFLGVDPRWDPLRREPGFRQLLARLGVVDHRAVEIPRHHSQT